MALLRNYSIVVQVWGARDKLKVGDKLGPLVETMEMCLKSADLVASLRNDSALYEQLVTPLLEQMVQCSNFVKEYTGSTGVIQCVSITFIQRLINFNSSQT